MNKPKNRPWLQAATLTLIAAVAGPAVATEGGGGIYPNGTENFMVGAMPPPGTYYMLYGSH